MKDYPFSQQTIGHIIRDKAIECGDRVFLEFEDGTTATFAQCDEISDRIANGLLAMGLKKGDTLATFLPNSIDGILIWLGASKAGIIEVPINLANKAGFLSHILNNSCCTAIIIDHTLIDRLAFIQNDLPSLKSVVVWGDSDIGLLKPSLKFQLSAYADLLAESSEQREIPVQGSDPAAIIYTSGTTGPAKGVLLSNAGIYSGARDYVEAVRATRDDALFTCLPLFHGNARFLCVYPALQLGAKAVIYERFSASRFWDQIRKHKATIFNSLGAIGTFIFSQPRKPDDADNTVRVCAAFPMPATIYEQFEKRYNLKVVEGYGLTETAVITYNPWDNPKIGSCGKEAPNFEVRIVDEHHFPVSPGTIGEIVVRGKRPWVLCLGYINMPDKTVELVQNHYYHTGDAGYMDEEGYLYFKDRIKDYIRRRGENISSTEIENVVLGHPAIQACAAIGVKSEHSEDEVKIVVELKENAVLPPEELLSYCIDRMPYFAVPRYVEFSGCMPRTANEKIQKAVLRQAGITPSTWDREEAGFKVSRHS
jgi:crotonobetaine/carnitine-CoA ligase